MHGVVEEMDRRGKSESVAISSAIDMGESETVSRDSFFCPLGVLAQAAWQVWKHVTAPSFHSALYNFYFQFTQRNKNCPPKVVLLGF